MVRLRGGSSGTGRTTTLRNEETVVPSTRKSARRSEKCGDKRKQTDQIEPQPTTLPIFIDGGVRDKSEWISQKGYITPRIIIPSEFCKLDLDHVLKFFNFQKWSHILSLPNTYYPEMLNQFFANLRKGSSHTELISRVNGVDIL